MNAEGEVRLRGIRGIAHKPRRVQGEGLAVAQLHAQDIDGGMDPFLQIDAFALSEAFFAPHPHAGFNAVTYILPESPVGFINRDSVGHRQRIAPGGLHWTTAGRGVQHEEVPEVRGVAVLGLQMFVNLPAALKHIAPGFLHLEPAGRPARCAFRGLRRAAAGRAGGGLRPVRDDERARHPASLRRLPRRRDGHPLDRALRRRPVADPRIPEEDALNVLLTLNGRPRRIETQPEMPLLWMLRDDLNLTGTKFGCGAALCGACTVLVDGAPTRSCQTRMQNLGGKSVTTIEGLTGREADAVRAAWRALDVVQCGWCQSGQVVAATALLRANKAPTDADIDSALDGNLCRCGTYHRIRAAVHAAAGQLKRSVRA